jgi:hypothetical protein
LGESAFLFRTPSGEWAEPSVRARLRPTRPLQIATRLPKQEACQPEPLAARIRNPRRRRHFLLEQRRAGRPGSAAFGCSIPLLLLDARD